ncbi:siderophore-interacting protein [Humibacter antri]
MAANWQRGVLKAMGVKNHPVEVVGITDFTPWYRRIRVVAPGFLDGFELHPTVWVRLWVPSPTRDKLVQRGYTIVEPNQQTGEFSLDFVLHEPTGSAASWAKDARIGTRAQVAHTPQRLAIDSRVHTILLAGDTTAVPAINTVLEAAPDLDKHVVIQDAHADRHALPLSGDARTTLTWAAPDDGSVVAALWASVAGANLDPEHTYLWAAGERRLVKAVRDHARTALALGRHRQHTQYYWIRGHSAG